MIRNIMWYVLHKLANEAFHWETRILSLKPYQVGLQVGRWSYCLFEVITIAIKPQTFSISSPIMKVSATPTCPHDSVVTFVVLESGTCQIPVVTSHERHKASPRNADDDDDYMTDIYSYPLHEADHHGEYIIILWIYDYINIWRDSRRCITSIYSTWNICLLK